jgi:signal transduction histidine kinase
MGSTNPVNHFDWNLFILGPTAVFLVLIIFIIYVVTAYKASQRRFIEEKKRLKELFEAEIVRAQLEMNELTLQRIASEIHDHIGHNLTIAAMNMPFLKSDDDNQAAVDTRQLVQQSLSDLRNLSRSLSNGYMLDLGLEAAIRREIELLSKPGNPAFSLHVHRVEPSVKIPVVSSDQSEVFFFRCVQESLSNVIKYASASEVTIQVWYAGEACVRVEVTDNGIGIDPEKVEKGVGLRSMEQRMKMLNGQLEILHANPGTRLRFAISQF